MKRVPVVLLIFAIFPCKSTKLPPAFPKCNRTQSDFDECVLRAAQKGLNQLAHPFKELDMPTFDPLEMVDVPVGTEKDIVAVDQTNCKFYGIDKTQLERFEFDFVKKQLYAEGVVPEIRKYCDYKLDGKILLMPIKATIPTTIIIHNMTVTGLLPYTEVKKGGKTYFKFHDTKITIDPGHIYFHFANLFTGIENMTDLINEKFNENWYGVFIDFKEDYEKESSRIAQNLVNRFFSKVSVEEAFD